MKTTQGKVNLFMASSSLVLVYSALFIVQILFGINFVASKIIVGKIDPVHWALIRFVVSGLVLVVASLIKQKGKSGKGLNYFLKINWLCFLAFTIGQVALLKGIKLTTSINTSIITSSIPIWTLVMVILKKQETFSLKRGAGFLVSFIGVLIIRGIDDFSLSNETFIGDLLVLIGAMSSGFFIANSRKFLNENNHWWASSWMFLFATCQIGLVAMVEAKPMPIPTMTTELVVSMVFSAIGATLLTYFLSNWALTKVASGNVALFIYLQPIVATIVAWGYLGEVVTAQTILSGILIIVGFLLAIDSKSIFGLKERS